MRITLINPSSQFMISQAVMPPLGLWYIADSLKMYDVTICDLGRGDTILAADVYGVTGASVNAPQIKEIVSRLEGFKIAGGPHATACPEDMLEMGFDAVVCGEGDEVIQQIVEERVTGIIYAPRIKDLNPYFPDRRNSYRYHYEIDGILATTMITSRGCPHNCGFCSKEVYGRLRVPRSTESVLYEVNSVMYQGYKAIMFYDDTFMTGRKRLIELCEAFRDKGLVWRCLARADDADEDILRLMKESGCREIGVGVESGSQKIISSINKHETVEQQRQCIYLAHKVGLRVKAFMIVGLPGESAETVEETDQFLAETKPDALDVSILAVYPGSDIYNHPEKYDVTFGPPTHFKGKDGAYVCNVSTSQMTSQEIMQAHDYLYQKYS